MSRSDHHDDEDKASYYSYSEYTLPASEVSVNRRWYNQMENWRNQIRPGTAMSTKPVLNEQDPVKETRQRNGRHSSTLVPPSEPWTNDMASTVSPKESISARPTPRVLSPALPEIRPSDVKENTQIHHHSQQARTNGANAPVAMQVKSVRRPPSSRPPSPSLAASHHRVVVDADETLTTAPTSSTIKTLTNSAKLYPVTDPHRLKLPPSTIRPSTSSRTVAYNGPRIEVTTTRLDDPSTPNKQTLETPPRFSMQELDKSLPPLPPSVLAPRQESKQPSKPATVAHAQRHAVSGIRAESLVTVPPLGPSHKSHSQHIRPKTTRLVHPNPADSFETGSTTSLQARSTRSPVTAKAYRKGTPYPSVVNYSSNATSSVGRDSEATNSHQDAIRMLGLPSRSSSSTSRPIQRDSTGNLHMLEQVPEGGESESTIQVSFHFLSTCSALVLTDGI